MDLVGLLVVLMVIGLLPAAIASGKGRSFVQWWIFGGLLFIVALPAAIIAKDARHRCPHCREPVQPRATVCPHCRNEIAWETVQVQLR